MLAQVLVALVAASALAKLGWAESRGPAPTDSLAAQAFTPREVVEAALNMAEVGLKDHLIDLGSGDGRVVIAAAQRGATATGYELDGNLIAHSVAAAQAAGVDKRTNFRQDNLLNAEFDGKTIVFVHLSRSGMRQIHSQILPRLESGTRLVSVTYDLPGIQPDSFVFAEDDNDVQYILYLWIVE